MLSDIIFGMNICSRDGYKLESKALIGGISPRFDELLSDDASFGSEVNQ